MKHISFLLITLLLGWSVVTAASVVAPGAKVEKLAGGMKFTEGSVAAATNKVVFSDIPNSKLMQEEKNGLSEFRKSEQANGNILDLQGYNFRRTQRGIFGLKRTAGRRCWQTSSMVSVLTHRTMWR